MVGQKVLIAGGHRRHRGGPGALRDLAGSGSKWTCAIRARLEGRRAAGVPHDADGSIGVDEHGRAIGLERVFAAGDVTVFP